MTFEELSPRNQQIVELLALGFSNPEIAEDLGCPLSCVKTWVHQLCLEAGVERRIRLILHFYELHRRTSQPKLIARQIQQGFQ